MINWLKILFFSLALIGSSYYFSLTFKELLADPNFFLNLSLNAYIPVIKVIGSLYLLSVSFGLLVTLSPAVYPKLFVFILAALPIIFTSGSMEIGVTAALVLFLIFLFGTWEIRNQLRSYFNFNPRLIFSSSLHLMLTLLNIYIAVLFYFSYTAYTNGHSFEIPTSFIDTISNSAIKNLTDQFNLEQSSNLIEQTGLSKQDLEKLQKNSNVKVTIENAKKDAGDKVKEELKKNVQGYIDQYKAYIPVVVTLLLYLTFQSLTGLSFFLVPMMLSIAFFVLEKSKVITFETQTQEVKRLVLKAEKANVLSEKKISDKELKDWIN